MDERAIPIISKFLTIKQLSPILSCSKSMRPTDYDLRAINGIFYRDGTIMQNTVFSKSWFYEGKLHRDHDQPARIFHQTGTKEWYKHGKKHRDTDKPAYISSYTKSIVFYKEGLVHRDNGPALIIEGEREMWYKENTIHNGYDHPAAIIYQAHNRIRREWWNDGKYLKMEMA